MHLHFVVVAISMALLLDPVSIAWCDNPEPYPQDSKSPAPSNDEYYELLKVFVDTLDQVERNYVKDLSRRDLLEAAIEGMVSKLDQYSTYIPPKELDRFRTSVESEFGGIGIQIVKERNRFLQVISPVVGSPAYRAGVLAGDEITHIEGIETKGMSREDAVQRIKGEVGTNVELTVRERGEQPRTVTLTRAVVRLETVLGDRRDKDDRWEYMYDREANIAYVRVTGFAKHTVRQLRRVLQQLREQEMRGLILDLRSNPGGLLSSAIEISDLFVASGRIVSTEGRNTRPRVWDAHQRGTFDGFPMAVLVNGSSASASEIVAACLQDHGRAVVVGERTFGKGSVQNVIALENGRSALKLTTASYKRPSGKNIHRFPGTPESGEWGVRPNDGMAVEIDIQEHRRLALLRQRKDIVSRGGEEEKPPQDAADGEHADEAFEKALSHIKVQIAKEILENKTAAPTNQPDP